MMTENKNLIFLFLLEALAFAVYAQGNSSTPLSFIGWRMEDAVRLVLCALWALATTILALLVVVSGLKYLTSEDSERKGAAKKTIVQGLIAFILVVVACPTVNYIVHGSDVKEFKCDCIRTVPPTTTTSTTTTTWTFVTVTTVTTTTTTTSTTSTIWYPKSGGGRFLLVGECVYGYGPHREGDFSGVIFNMDGTIHKDDFLIDSDQYDPAALAVGPNRFFVAYGSNAVVLDWEGATVKAKYSTRSGYYPVKAIQTGNNFYLLLSPKEGSGGCTLQEYSLQGDLENAYSIDIGNISHTISDPQWSKTYFSEGDMAFANGNLFITWPEYTSELNEYGLPTEVHGKVYGMLYDLSGKKVKDRFVITSFNETSDNTGFFGCYYILPFENAEVEPGAKYFLVAFGKKIFLFDFNGQLKGEKESSLVCAHDLIYGDGKFLEVKDNDAQYYNDDGNDAGTGTFGGHGDVPTSLAYGNKMFVGVVAIHEGTGDGIGASFMDYNGQHLIDTLPLLMAESPGWAAYDW